MYLLVCVYLRCCLTLKVLASHFYRHSALGLHRCVVRRGHNVAGKEFAEDRNFGKLLHEFWGIDWGFFRPETNEVVLLTLQNALIRMTIPLPLPLPLPRPVFVPPFLSLYTPFQP